MVFRILHPNLTSTLWDASPLARIAEPKVTVVSMAWFEYLPLSAWLRARRPRRVPVGELAIGESEPDGQIPASAETRLVPPPIPDTVGLLDVLPLGALETRHAGPRISGWRTIIDRDRELCTKAAPCGRSAKTALMALDAVLCLFSAKAAADGLAVVDDPAAAEREGWIAVHPRMTNE